MEHPALSCHTAIPWPAPPDQAEPVPLPRRHRPSPRRAIGTWLARTLYRCTHPVRYHHNDRLWPHIRIAHDAQGRIEGARVHGSDVPLANGHTILVDHTAPGHLIATGPSVRDIDYRTLSLRNVLGVNGAVALQQHQPITFHYYCIIDTGFVRNRSDLVARIISQPLVLFITPEVLARIVQCLGAAAIRCRIFLVENVQFPAHRPALSPAAITALGSDPALKVFDAQHALGYSLDMRRGMFDAGTVSYTGLQVLTWLGLDTLYLHGMDMQQAAHTPRFYERCVRTMQPSGLDRDFATLIAPAFQAASALWRARGIRVHNLSPRSALDASIAPHTDWRSL